MATIDELLRRANRIVDDTFDNIDWIDWFNQCQNEAISEVLFLPKNATLTINQDGNFTLPSDFKDTLVVLSNNVSDYRIFGNTIVIDNEDITELDIVYNAFPTQLENNPSQVPDIPVQFHDIYVFYGAMMAMLSDEEHERYDKFHLEFTKVLRNLKLYMDRKKSEFRRYIGLDRWTVIR